jgi:MerR family transcriptional regulator, light-induced transcriptional regulator
VQEHQRPAIHRGDPKVSEVDQPPSDEQQGGLPPSVADLRAAFERFDEAEAQRAFDRVFAEVELETLLVAVVLRSLHELGKRWERFEIDVAQEHFASGILRARLLGLARGWSRGDGPQAVLACPPAEQHDIGSITFGLALRQHGWRIHFLGADVPVAETEKVATTLGADLIVFSGAMPHTLYAVIGDLLQLGREHRVAVGGAGARAFGAAGERLIVLDHGAVEEAKRVAALLGPPHSGPAAR